MIIIHKTININRPFLINPSQPGFIYKPFLFYYFLMIKYLISGLPKAVITNSISKKIMPNNKLILFISEKKDKKSNMRKLIPIEAALENNMISSIPYFLKKAKFKKNPGENKISKETILNINSTTDIRKIQNL